MASETTILETATLAIPKSIVHRLEERARIHGKPVAAEAAELLSKALDEDEGEAKLMEEIGKDREEAAKQGVYITDDFIREAKNWGRE
jgi:plasmid stability protein